MAGFIRMPSVMANATDAVLSAWLARPGQKLEVGDPLAEIETDKAVVEYAAETSGTVGRLLVEAGTRVAVGQPIVVVLEDGEDASALPTEESAQASVATPASSAADTSAHQPPEPGLPAQQAPSKPRAPSASAASDPDPGGVDGARRFATPIARRIAAQRGIDLAQLVGTGPNGRIVRRDVEAYRSAAARTTESEARATGGHRDVPLTGMRRAIAARLTESKSTVPHFYLTAHVEVDRLLAVRREVNVSSPRKVSLNDFVVRAVARALVDVPAANAIWLGDHIRYFDGVDLAVAVAVQNGLVTPVVRGAERLGLVELSAELARLADQARSGRLQQHQLEGGSFAVSNLGMHGVHEFAAIINPPQAGILAVGAARPAPVVTEDGELRVGQVMTATLSADHRVIDGAIAAAWMRALVERLQNPVGLLI